MSHPPHPLPLAIWNLRFPTPNPVGGQPALKSPFRVSKTECNLLNLHFLLEPSRYSRVIVSESLGSQISYLCFISFHFISFHFFLFYFISFHFILFYFIKFYWIFLKILLIFD